MDVVILISKMENNHLFTCPCCKNISSKVYEYYDVCSFCCWIYDPIQNVDINYEGGANDLSLTQQRDLFSLFYENKKMNWYPYTLSNYLNYLPIIDFFNILFIQKDIDILKILSTFKKNKQLKLNNNLMAFLTEEEIVIKITNLNTTDEIYTKIPLNLWCKFLHLELFELCKNNNSVYFINGVLINFLDTHFFLKM
jgi:hypothetical protein